MATNPRYFEFIEFKYDALTNDINKWLASVYKKSGLVFSSASPYGQVVNVLKELFQHNMLYVKQALMTINLEESVNEKAIKNIARIAGYNAARPIGATGTLKFTLKNINIQEKIKGGSFTLPNHLVLKNKSNGLNYSLELGAEQLTIPVQSGTIFYLPLVQGIYKDQYFTGNGKSNQSYTVQIGNGSYVDNFRYQIWINNRILSPKDHMYDMLYDEYACYTWTAFNGGLDIYFGTADYGIIPADGAQIRVNYLLTNGTIGEILNPRGNDWKIQGTVLDLEGNELNLEKLFDITTETMISFASNGDSTTSIKANIPYVSRNFVLATPAQFIFHLGKLNMFSKINAYNKLEDNDFSLSETAVEDSLNQLKASMSRNESRAQINVRMDQFLAAYAKQKNNLNDNEIYLYLIPDITKYFNNNVSYFTVPYDVFYLDEDEQNKVLTYLNATGTMSITTEVIILQPVITSYIMFVYVRRFSTTQEDNIRQEIISRVSNYLIKNTRFDRIPKSDLIQLIKDNVTGVDSVDIHFLSRTNEDYHAKGAALGYVGTDAYNPNLTLGLDPVHGDIVIGLNEYPLVRGGWKDRNGVYYNADPSNMNGLSSINIIFNGVTQNK